MDYALIRKEELVHFRRCWELGKVISHVNLRPCATCVRIHVTIFYCPSFLDRIKGVVAFSSRLTSQPMGIGRQKLELIDSRSERRTSCGTNRLYMLISPLLIRGRCYAPILNLLKREHDRIQRSESKSEFFLGGVCI